MTRSGLDRPSVDALQDALAAEHAALWCYGLVLAFLPAPELDRARSAAAAHRELRGTVQRMVTAAGTRPVSALPAYDPPQPVTDAAGAAALVVVAEADTLAAWKSVLERTSDSDLRRTALDVLEAGTLRLAQWRTVIGARPAIPPFPGRR